LKAEDGLKDDIIENEGQIKAYIERR